MDEQHIENKKNIKSSVKFEIAFYEAVLKRSPDFVACLKMLAELYTIVGRYHEGLVLDQRLAQLLAYDETVFYNLACSYSLVEDIENSLVTLKKAIALGFSDYRYIRSDPDLVNVRKDKRFDSVVPRE